MEARGLVEGYSFWTFSDIFEENYFPSNPFHGGFGLLNLHGIAKPTYRAFELLHHLGDKILVSDGLHETVDAWFVRGAKGVTVLLTNHAPPRHSIKTERVTIHLYNAHEPTIAYVERIDEKHANAKKKWNEMGQPEYLSVKEVELLQAASQLKREPVELEYQDGTIRFSIDIPPHSVVAFNIELPSVQKTNGGGTR
jgi:xylan 1,4-beta-xylosidase